MQRTTYRSALSSELVSRKSPYVAPYSIAASTISRLDVTHLGLVVKTRHAPDAFVALRLKSGSRATISQDGPLVLVAL